MRRHAPGVDGLAYPRQRCLPLCPAAALSKCCAVLCYAVLRRYVVRKDLTMNMVYVSRQYYQPDKQRDTFTCGPFNWLGQERPLTGQGSPPLFVKVRHGPNMYQCSLELGGQALLLQQPLGQQQHLGQPLVEQQQHAAASGVQQQAGMHGAGQSLPTQGEQPAGGGGVVVGGASTSSGSSPQLYGRVTLASSDQGLAPGQYAVFYQKGVCMGAAVILEAAA